VAGGVTTITFNDGQKLTSINATIHFTGGGTIVT
jgi:hypothetical protein